jgi:signal peptidase I
MSIGLIVSPKTSYSLDSMGILSFLPLLTLGMIADACRKPMNRIGFRGWGKLIAFLIAFVTIPLTVRHSLVEPFVVPTGGAMEPSLMGYRHGIDGRAILGDRILVDKASERSHAPQHGDIIVYNSDGLPGSKPGLHYIQRVAGIPGETVSIDPPNAFVNGPAYTVTLGPDEYFLLGDNSSVSKDSRFFGPIKQMNIVGRAFLVYAPSDRKGWIE